MTDTTDSVPLDGLLLTRDLFFSSKVTGTAQALGLRVGVEPDPSRVAERVAGCRLLLIDLDVAPLDVAALVASLPSRAQVRIVAFGPHVNAARLQEAHEAGCEEVMPRSRFSAELPRLLRPA